MKSVLSLCALLACSACGASLGFSTPIESAFVTPNANGTIRESAAFFGGAGDPDPVYSRTTGNGYSHSLSIVPDVGVRAWSGLIPGASVSTLPPRGTVATYSGGFNVISVQIDTATSNNIQTSGRYRDRGALDFVLDVTAGTFIGTRQPRLVNTPTGPQQFNDISVNGRFAGNTLTGTVNYNGTTGPLQGLIGADEAIGVFHGNSSTQLHSGGFIVNPD